MVAIEQEIITKNLSNEEQQNLFTQMETLLEFTQDHISRKDNIVSITVSNETHTLTLKQKES